MVCIFVERVKRNCFTIFFSLSGLECLSLDVVSVTVERCCFLLLVDCMYIYSTFLNNCFSLLLYRLSLSTFDIRS